jgi:hypothetical protein
MDNADRSAYCGDVVEALQVHRRCDSRCRNRDYSSALATTTRPLLPRTQRYDARLREEWDQFEGIGDYEHHAERWLTLCAALRKMARSYSASS